MLLRCIQQGLSVTLYITFAVIYYSTPANVIVRALNCVQVSTFALFAARPLHRVLAFQAAMAQE